MRKSLISLSLLFISLSGFSQRVKVDTTYYQGNDIVESGADFTTFEVCEIDRKGRKDGECIRYNDQEQAVEVIDYVKDQRNGSYSRLYPNGGLMLEGTYLKGDKDAVWMSYDAEGKPLNLEFYEKGRAIISRSLELIPEVNSKDDVAIVVVEEQASFPGGVRAWLNFLDGNMEYPKEAKEKRISGDVYLRFMITKEGFVIKPAVTQSPSDLLSQEALRMLKICPNWIPKKVKGEPVDSYMEFRIAFRLG